MPRVHETIPPHLADAAEAARAWFSSERGSEFKLTGILDPEEAPEAGTAARELQLILCGQEDGQDVCLRERFEIAPATSGFDVTHLAEATTDPGSPAPLLDPPVGVRAAWLERTLPRHAFVVLLFYRGFWCPPCRPELRGYAKAGVLERVRAAGGEVYAITSEPQTLAKNAEQDWATGLEHVGDPHQEIAGACAERGWLSLFTNDWGEHSPDNRWIAGDWVSHPKGYFQPGVLALSREGRVLYRWRCRPSRQNLGGAIARPTPDHVWGRVDSALRDPEDAPDAAIDADPSLDTPPTPWPVFVTLLLANGWFLRPMPFDQRAGENTVPRRIRRAALRVPLFVAGWIAAGLVLPGWIVALAFAVWLARVVPGIREVNARFQNVRPGEEPTVP